jgi:membrane peptidoglycan carboxypeptidase
LYALYGTQRMSLADRAHAIGVHPLELWTVRYLREHPSASRGEAVDASRADRVAAYAWLFNTRSKSAQDARIRTMLERDAFAQIHEQWQRLGYPFQSISPSLGTALGSSADRPTALAELVGIIVNGGLRLPTVRLPTLEFATGTPYETHFARKHVPPVRVLEPEVAASVRSLLESVVTSGTAVRLNGAFRGPDGSPMPVGGKTGTGDHRVESIGRDGRMSASRVVSRSGTFVFFLGSRHFGTVTAYVSGSRAADYAFTSALPTQVLKSLAPVLGKV